MSYTPGPWTFEIGQDELYWGEGCEFYAYRITAPTKLGPLMGGSKYYPWTPTELDDWKLIAAAPDLLAFAQHFLEVWAAAGPTDSPLEAEARAAIAKATT